MEELFKLGFGIYEKYGLAGLLLIYFLGDKIIWPRLMQWKKGDNYVSFKDVKELKENLNLLNSKIVSHLEKEAIEDIERGIMKNDIVHIQGNQVRTDDNVEKIFNLISKLKDEMIEMGYGKGRI